MTDLNILVVIPSAPGWVPGANSFEQLGCTGHPVWVSAAGMGEMLSRPGMVTRCVLHVSPEVLRKGNWIVPESIKQQLFEETGQYPSVEFIEAMRRFYLLMHQRL